MKKAEEIYHRFVNYEWNEIAEGMKVSILRAIDEAQEERQKLRIHSVSNLLCDSFDPDNTNVIDGISESQPNVMQWVAVADRKPDVSIGKFLVCLKNDAVMEMSYSKITDKWWTSIDEVRSHNPVMYWMELPKPPCL